MAAKDKNEFINHLQSLLLSYLGAGKFNLDNLAELIDIKPRTLQRCLAKHQTSFSEILLSVKMQQAVNLIQQDSIKIIDIAYELGYQDPAHFTRAFKAWCQLSPTEYRKVFMKTNFA